MSADAVPYGGVIEIGGRFYSPGPEADKARKREEAKERQRAERAAAEEAERERREELEERYAPLLGPWPAVRKELLRRQQEARERLVAAVAESPVFSAYVELLAAERAADLGAREVASARSSIDHKPRTQMPVRYSDLLEVLREVAMGRAAGALADAKASTKGA